MYPQIAIKIFIHQKKAGSEKLNLSNIYAVDKIQAHDDFTIYITSWYDINNVCRQYIGY